MTLSTIGKTDYSNIDFPYLPTSKKEMEQRGWEQADIVLFSGDAYVDHPAFGAAVIGRVLEYRGYKVAIVPQPNWRDDLRDFKKLGAPRLFFAIAAGAMDSMVNHYTANRRLRSDDAYTPDGKAGHRPDYPTKVYGRILKQLYPDTPLIIGGIEASLRRLTHYDYWQDSLSPSILMDSRADLLVYGMGEKPIIELADRLEQGEHITTIQDVKQTVFTLPRSLAEGLLDESTIRLHSFEACTKSKIKFAENFKILEIESNKWESLRLLEDCGEQTIVVNPTHGPMSESELDMVYDLPYTRQPHPRYKGKRIPAYEMIRHSINIHRGCFGGCSFCTISAHQGKFVSSRSEQSVLKELEQVTSLPDFKGYVSDVGGPSANMYRMKGKDEAVCKKCRRASCLFPRVCNNLHNDHRPLTDLYKTVRQHPAVKKAFIGSGIRYDLFLNETGFINEAGKHYFDQVMEYHVSGRLKVAPEHTSKAVLNSIRKPSFALFEQLKLHFDRVNQAKGLKLQLIPYFISALPYCKEKDMQELADITRRMGYHLEQVQSFTPTPMTLASTIYYTGIDPYTGEKAYIARSKEEKLRQQDYFFWYKKTGKTAARLQNKSAYGKQQSKRSRNF